MASARALPACWHNRDAGGSPGPQAYTGLRAAALRLKQARQAYLNDLQQRYAACLRDLEARLVAARQQARAEEDAALATAAEAYREAVTAAVEQTAETRSRFAPLLAPWDDSSWAEYALPQEAEDLLHRAALTYLLEPLPTEFLPEPQGGEPRPKR